MEIRFTMVEMKRTIHQQQPKIPNMRWQFESVLYNSFRNGWLPSDKPFLKNLSQLLLLRCEFTLKLITIFLFYFVLFIKQNYVIYLNMSQMYRLLVHFDEWFISSAFFLSSFFWSQCLGASKCRWWRSRSTRGGRYHASRINSAIKISGESFFSHHSIVRGIK